MQPRLSTTNERISTALLLLLMRNQLRGLGLEALQQECSVHNECNTDRHQGVHENVQLRLPEAVLAQPLEHVRLRVQVAPVDVGESPPEVDDGGQMRHPPLPRVAGVRHFHEGYVEVVGLAVDVLQLLHDYFALFRIVLV